MVRAMRDLARDIFRQRMIIEGLTQHPLNEMLIKKLLNQLCVDLNMVSLMEPLIHDCEEYGLCGFMHWKTSGCHIYSWEHRHPYPFFSIDIYTCKPFDEKGAVDCVKNVLQGRLIKMDYETV